jgi:peptidoglycan/xylan/chitin deacetylase (PgdA/CDA1 family)
VRGVGLLRRLARQIAPKAIILLYHRVIEVDSDPQWLCVPPWLFAEHLEILRHKYYPLSLVDLCERMRQGNLPPKAIVVTFDDGYADNLHAARPLLKQFDVPATTFVVAGQVGKTEEFWWDELARILLATPVLPPFLHLTIAGKVYTWSLKVGDSSVPIQHWNVIKETDNPCHAAYREIALLLEGLDNQTREGLLTGLREWAGVDRMGRTDYRSLSIEELGSLAQDGLVEIGAHTMTHPILSRLSRIEQLAEIAESKRLLEKLAGRPVVSFSYPFGYQESYSLETVQLVKETGFACACSNFPGKIQPGTDPYQLPRFLVRDWKSDEFSCKLEEWFAA